jgi:hypothetical protein
VFVIARNRPEQLQFKKSFFDEVSKKLLTRVKVDENRQKCTISRSPLAPMARSGRVEPFQITDKSPKL